MTDRLRFLFNYPIRYAIPGSMLLLLIGSLTWGYVVSLKREIEIIEQSAVSRMQIDMAFLQDSIEHAAARGHRERPQQLLGALAINLPIQDALLADDSGVIVASMNRDDTGENALAVIRRRNAMDAALELFLRHITVHQRSLMQLSTNRQSLYGFYPVALPPARGTLAVGHGWLYMKRDLSAARTMAKSQVLYTLAQTFWPVVLFSVLLIFLSHYGINRRLKPLLDQAARIGQGNLSAESSLSGRDEFAVLSRALDSMADNLTKNLEARQKAEQVLKESESILSSFYAVAPLRMAILQIFGEDIVFLRVNPAAAADLGGTPASVEYHRAADLKLPAGLPGIWKSNMQKSKERGTPVRFEYSTIVNGLETHMSATTVHVPGTEYFALLADDITQRKQMENALRASESEYRSLFDDALDLIHICDVHGRILDANRAELRTMGYTKQEYLGRYFLDLAQPDARRGIEEQLNRVLAGEILYELPALLVNRFGQSVHVMMNAFPHFDNNGRVIELRAMMRDVTDKRQRDLLLGSILDTAIDGVVTTDQEGLIQMANHTAVKMLALEDSLKGMNFLDFVSNAESMQDLFEEKRPRSRHARRTNGTSFPVELGISRFRLDSADYFTVFFRDITQRKSLEEQLDHSRRMEAVGKLAGGIAHDFNNILMIVLGHAEMLLAQTHDVEDRKGLSAIQQAAERGSALTEQLLTFSKKHSHDPAPVDLNSLISSMEEMLRRTLGENILFSTSLADDLVHVVADKTQMEQIVLNLVLNARDAMPEGGRLWIETSNVFLDEDFCKRTECAPGKYAGVTVSDSGFGMTPEIQARIFEPFFTTKAPGKGTGLGLATVYSCVNQNGGCILVKSAPGRGTTFDLFFPASNELARIEQAKPAPASRVHGVGETILLVEDEAGVREIAHLALQREGYRIMEAVDAESALAIAASSPLDIDLLLSDIVMPGLSGRRLAEKLKSRVKGGRVLLMTGYTEDAAASAYPVIRKPFTPRSLVEKVREILDQAESEVHSP